MNDGPQMTLSWLTVVVNGPQAAKPSAAGAWRLASKLGLGSRAFAASSADARRNRTCRRRLAQLGSKRRSFGRACRDTSVHVREGCGNSCAGAPGAWPRRARELQSYIRVEWICSMPAAHFAAKLSTVLQRRRDRRNVSHHIIVCLVEQCTFEKSSHDQGDMRRDPDIGLCSGHRCLLPHHRWQWQRLCIDQAEPSGEFIRRWWGGGDTEP